MWIEKVAQPHSDLVESYDWTNLGVGTGSQVLLSFCLYDRRRCILVEASGWAGVALRRVFGL